MSENVEHKQQEQLTYDSVVRGKPSLGLGMRRRHVPLEREKINRNTVNEYCYLKYSEKNNMSLRCVVFSGVKTGLIVLFVFLFFSSTVKTITITICGTHERCRRWSNRPAEVTMMMTADGNKVDSPSNGSRG